MTEEIKVGDLVHWASQARGSWKKKTGTVVQVVAAGQLPSRELFKTLYTGAGCGSPRKVVSYVVEVFDSPAEKIGRHIYWPLPSKLNRVEHRSI